MLTLLRDNVIARLVTYYVVSLALFATIFLAFPTVGDIMTAERARQIEAAPTGVAPLGGSGLMETYPLFAPQVVIPVVMGMLGAFLLALPVAWVYLWTRPPRKERKAVAQTLLVLPIGIALVVFLVKGSLALAFGLAGIVAAVRWRTSLADTMDAVFIFVIIGIGLSAGVQLLFVSFVASVVFNAAMLGVWRLNFGQEDRVLVGWRLEKPTAGNAQLAASTTGQHALPAGHSAEEGAQYNTLLRLHVSQTAATEQAVAPVLDEHSNAWRLRSVSQESETNSVLEYEARFQKSTDLAALIREIEQRGAPNVRKVELTRGRPERR